MDFLSARLQIRHPRPITRPSRSHARAHWHARADRARARELRRDALALFREAGTAGDDGKSELERWIDESP